MNPNRLAIAWCIYTILFIALVEVLDAYIPKEWFLEVLSISKNDAGGIELGARFFLYFTSTFILIWLTAKYAHSFTGISEWQQGNGTKKRIKLIAIWSAFLVPYLAIVILLNFVLPEVWLHRLITGHDGMSCDDVVWDGVFIRITLALALPINGAVIVLLSSQAIKRRQRRHSAQQKTACKTADQ
jgi:hypothetical protein